MTSPWWVPLISALAGAAAVGVWQRYLQVKQHEREDKIREEDADARDRDRRIELQQRSENAALSLLQRVLKIERLLQKTRHPATSNQSALAAEMFHIIDSCRVDEALLSSEQVRDLISGGLRVLLVYDSAFDAKTKDEVCSRATRCMRSVLGSVLRREPLPDMAQFQADIDAVDDFLERS